MTSREQDAETIALAPDRVLDLVHRSIQWGSVVMALSEVEWGIMAALLASRRPLSTNDLLEQVWHDRFGQPYLVWVVINRLRRKIEPDPRHPCIVRRNRTFGYWLALPPHPASVPPAEQLLEVQDATR